MKRIISLLLCLVLLTALAAPVSAAAPEIIFTADSGFTPGCTVTVDEIATGESIFDNGSDSELEAYLEPTLCFYTHLTRNREEIPPGFFILQIP